MKTTRSEGNVACHHTETLDATVVVANKENIIATSLQMTKLNFNHRHDGRVPQTQIPCRLDLAP
jgi:hypothetical protein